MMRMNEDLPRRRFLSLGLATLGSVRAHMDPKLRQDVAAWLEFFRDMGIEDVYRSATPAQETPQHTTPPQPMKVVPSTPSQQPVGKTVAVAPPAPALNLFESPAPVRKGPETLEQIRTDLGEIGRAHV